MEIKEIDLKYMKMIYLKFIIQEHFAYLKILKWLKNGLAKGGSLDNAVVVKDKEINPKDEKYWRICKS